MLDRIGNLLDLLLHLLHLLWLDLRAGLLRPSLRSLILSSACPSSLLVWTPSSFAQEIQNVKSVHAPCGISHHGT